MNRRKLTKFLDHRAVRSLDAARYYAETLGHPLNCFVTIAPCRGLVVHSQASADYFASIRNWIGIWIRRRNIRFTASWTIENNSGGTDPHMHILMHVTAQLISDFRTALARAVPPLARRTCSFPVWKSISSQRRATSSLDRRPWR